MEVIVIGSGSKGNTTILKTGEDIVIIDAGLPITRVVKEMDSHSLSADNVKAILVSHVHRDHADHIEKYIERFSSAKVYTPDEVASKFTLQRGTILSEQNYAISENIEFEAYPTSHDTNESFAFVIACEGKKLTYITDAGYIPEKYLRKYYNVDVLIIESNHDIYKLVNNENYPWYIRQRILSDKGHLSNEQALEYSREIIGQKTKQLILFHLSEENNCPNIVESLFSELSVPFVIAKQDETIEKIEV